MAYNLLLRINKKKNIPVRDFSSVNFSASTNDEFATLFLELALIFVIILLDLFKKLFALDF